MIDITKGCRILAVHSCDSPMTVQSLCGSSSGWTRGKQKKIVRG